MKSSQSPEYGHDFHKLEPEETSQSTPLYDPNFNGPIKKRSCTDIICCLIFIIFVGGLAVVAYFGYIYGNPRLLLYPQDSEKNLCGYGVNRGKPNLYFYDLLTCARLGPGVFVNGCPTTQVCVSECPNVTEANMKLGGLPPICNKDKYCAKYDDSKTCTQNIEDDECPAYIIASEPVLNRCVPKFISGALPGLGDVVDKTGQALNESSLSQADEFLRQFLKVKEYSDKIVQDLVSTWWMIVIGLVLAMLVSLLWITLMRWVAGPMVWLTILIFLGLFGFSCYYCFTSYFDTKDTEQAFSAHLGVVTFEFKQAKFWLAFGIISGILLLIVILVLIFLRERICIAIALIKEGSRAVGSMLFTLAWPVVPFFLQIGTIAFWATVAVFLASVGRGGDPSKNANLTGLTDEEARKQMDSLFQQIPCDVDLNTTGSDICGVIKYGGDEYTFYLQIYNLFMLFWLVNFFIALGQMTLAGAFASYYWAFSKPQDIPTFPLLSSFWRCIRYHLGSLAFGSLIIAIVQVIRVFLEYLDAKLKGTENKIAKFFLKCLKCCFWCLEKFLRFLNKNAYIMVAVYGKNFCVSAKNAFSLILRNVVRVVVIDKVTDFLMFIGKLVIVGGVTTAAYFFYDGRIPFLVDYKPNLNFYIAPVIVTALGSYVIAAAFFSVYDMAVDTLFLCFLEDIERHDGSAEKPYYMSKELMKILGKKNKFPKTE